jgi:tetratricopeptide (TPR) repeat protein
MKQFILIVFVFFTSILQGQVDKKYKEIDGLIAKNLMIDAITALKMLKENYSKDTVHAEYWLRYSKSSVILYRYEDAKGAIDKAIKIRPNNAEYYFEKATLYNQMKIIDEALSTINKAIEMDKKGKYYFLRGIIYEQLNDNQNAQSNYEQSILYKLQDPIMFSNLAILYAKDEKYNQALKMINESIRLDKTNAKSYSLRSRINFNLVNLDEAFLDRDIAVKMGNKLVLNVPDSINNGTKKQKLEFAANNFVVIKYYKQAIIAYTKLIDAKILKSDYFLNRGYCYYKLSDYDKAEIDYLQSLKLPNATIDLLYDNISLLYFDQSKFEKSIEYSTKRIELSPKNYTPYIDRGLCYRKLKKYKEAEQDFNKSLEINPNFFRAYGYRSFLHLELGEYHKSYDDASKSVQINPEYDYGYLILGQVKKQLGMSNYCDDLYKSKTLGNSEADIIIKEYCK